MSRKACLAESRAEEAPDVALVLRLERRGNRLLASFREDGKEWVGLPDMPIDFDRQVKVGIAAVSTATDQLIAEFEALRITRADGTEIMFVSAPGAVPDGR